MNSEPPFQITLTPLCRQRIHILTELAPALDLRRELRQALLGAEENLARRPRDWGDPYHNNSKLNTVYYARVDTVNGLRIKYHVHNDQAVVIVVDIEPLDGSPFAGG